MAGRELYGNCGRLRPRAPSPGADRESGSCVVVGMVVAEVRRLANAFIWSQYDGAVVDGAGRGPLLWWSGAGVAATGSTGLKNPGPGRYLVAPSAVPRTVALASHPGRWRLRGMPSRA